MVFDALKRALPERGVARVDRINTADLGMETVLAAQPTVGGKLPTACRR